MSTKEITYIDTRETIPGTNDRTVFDPQALQELAASIKEHDLIQPISVRWLDAANSYQIIAGERRFRACKHILGWDEIPAIIVDATDEEAAAMMLIENVSRDDLDPIDEALAYATRMKVYGWSVQDCAKHAGVSSIRVNFRIKLLRLRQELQGLVRNDQLPIGYARILADAELDNNRQMIAINRLRDNPKPTPYWFRREVSVLKEEQAQDSLFDTDFFTVQPTDEPKTEYKEPPHPKTANPPRRGNSIIEVLRNQAEYWFGAAQAWDGMGKPFKRQECEAAATALLSAIAVI